MFFLIRFGSFPTILVAMMREISWFDIHSFSPDFALEYIIDGECIDIDNPATILHKRYCIDLTIGFSVICSSFYRDRVSSLIILFVRILDIRVCSDPLSKRVQALLEELLVSTSWRAIKEDPQLRDNMQENNFLRLQRSTRWASPYMGQVIFLLQCRLLCD